MNETRQKCGAYYGFNIERLDVCVCVCARKTLFVCRTHGGLAQLSVLAGLVAENEYVASTLPLDMVKIWLHAYTRYVCM